MLSSDCISSSAYGTEEMLIFLLPAFGLAGFHILLPMTFVVLAVLLIMTRCYRQVVMIYTQAGGSYVVARENFGPKVAQIASVALLIDYIVTVAVQSAAGTAAITSLVPALRGDVAKPTRSPCGVVLVLAFGNLRGMREAGKAFALPTYFFVTMAGLVVVVGIVRESSATCRTFAARQHGMIDVARPAATRSSPARRSTCCSRRSRTAARRSPASRRSRTGSARSRSRSGRNARTHPVDHERHPRHARAGHLLPGLARRTRRRTTSGTPTVISQVAKAAFGNAWYGHIGFVLVQVATALILFTGANTPFTGFPFLASFIAEDSFLPRQMTRRGHRLAFSNGIIVLTVAALALILGGRHERQRADPVLRDRRVHRLHAWPGYGMAQYHRTHRERRLAARVAISLAGGVVSALVVVIFAVVKFTEGAWLVVVLFPVLWLCSCG